MTRRNRSQQSVQRIRQTAKRIALVVGGIFAVALTVSLFFDEMGVRRYIAMQKHARELELDIKDLEQMNGDLRVEVRRIQHDPARIAGHLFNVAAPAQGVEPGTRKPT